MPAGALLPRRRPRLRRYAGGSRPAPAGRDDRARAPSARPGERARAGAAGRACFARERAALAEAKHVIVTSRFTARLLAADFDVPPDKHHRRRARHRAGAARDGHRRAGAAPCRRLGRRRARATTCWCGRLPAIADLDWRLTIAGTPRPRAASRRCPRGAHRGRRPRRPHRTRRRRRRATLAAALRRRRRLRLAVALRGLRHGAGRGDGARPADRRLDRRRRRRDRA